MPPRLLVVEACFYKDISNQLAQGARASIEASGAHADFIQLPGVLEIPAAIRMAHDEAEYDGYVALGCVIRGETMHFEIVSYMSALGLMKLGTECGLAIGNGILTVENKQQARQRADPSMDNKGGKAVEACLALLAAAESFRDQANASS